VHKQLSRSDRVLGYAVTVRPILFFDFNQINEDVFAPEPNRGVQTVGDRFVKRLFLFRSPSFVPGYLDDHEVVGAMDTDVIGIKKKVIGVVLTNDLETVIFGDADTHERLINDPAYFLPVSGIFTFANINPNQWHKFSSSRFRYLHMQVYTVLLAYADNESNDILQSTMPKYNHPNSQGSHCNCTALRKASRRISQLYRRNRVAKLTPAGNARLSESDRLSENAQRGFEAAFGRAKSEALREAMQFLVSGEFVRAFEKTIAKAATL
jgi:hypothetical protein